MPFNFQKSTNNLKKTVENRETMINQCTAVNEKILEILLVGYGDLLIVYWL
jgi:hypothetical protein